MIKLNTPIRTEVDEDFFMDISDFRGYARSMMYPDPTGIDMSDELNDMVTKAVNSGKTTLEDAFKKLKGNNKELHIIPGASHVDLYDNLAVIPFDKIEGFFREYLK